MDLLERARALAACSLFAELAPAVVIRLAERARAVSLVPGDQRTTEDAVWIVADGELAIEPRAHHDGEPARDGAIATAGHALGLVRVAAPTTPLLSATAVEATTVIGLSRDDILDVLEEDPIALSALVSALARALVEVGS